METTASATRIAQKYLTATASALIYPVGMSASEDDGTFGYAQKIYMATMFNKNLFPSPSEASKASSEWQAEANKRAVPVLKRNEKWIESTLDLMMVTTAGGQGIVGKAFKAGNLEIMLTRGGGGFDCTLKIGEFPAAVGNMRSINKAVLALRATIKHKFGLSI